MGKEITRRDDSNSFFLEFVKFIICIMLRTIYKIVSYLLKRGAHIFCEMHCQYVLRYAITKIQIFIYDFFQFHGICTKMRT